MHIQTFNYAEMAMCIAPRPFMVERGHDDGVGLDHWVGSEFAKVQRGYTSVYIDMPTPPQLDFRRRL